jgi:hypothetical protein
MIMLQREGIAARWFRPPRISIAIRTCVSAALLESCCHRQVGWLTRVGPSVRMTEVDSCRAARLILPVKTMKRAGEILGMSSEEIRDLTDRQCSSNKLLPAK